MGGLFSRLRGLFFTRTLELVLVGLANAGKTTFCNFLHTGKFIEEGPTIGLNVKVMQKGGVTTKIWDLVRNNTQINKQANERPQQKTDKRGQTRDTDDHIASRRHRLSRIMILNTSPFCCFSSLSLRVVNPSIAVSGVVTLAVAM